MSKTKLKEKISALPLNPGVYLMKGAEGEVLYIGKALSLKKRVSSYFQKTEGHSPKVSVMVKKVVDIDILETPTEVDALLLEASLINEYDPPYNTRQKDDKSFPLIKISPDESNNLDVKGYFIGLYPPYEPEELVVIMCDIDLNLEKNKNAPDEMKKIVDKIIEMEEEKVWLTHHEISLIPS